MLRWESTGFRLFNRLDRRHDPGSSGQVFSEMNATPAVISASRAGEAAGDGDVMVQGRRRRCCGPDLTVDDQAHQGSATSDLRSAT
ncbi:MAG TPA: hypothetical protein VIA06_22010 [Candidatus Dormibacteraeota bacterium]|jgi:hypothetical protein|nr:hypothetical protein [Candidatus Dormibacteraeota bacterium]